MKNKLMIPLLVLSVFIMVWAEKKIIPLDDLMKPSSITIGKNDFYITDGVNVLVYSLKDFKMVSKFGKNGEGPGEFRLVAGRIYEWEDKLIINSPNKVSFFTKEGTLVSEKRVTTNGSSFMPFPGGFLGTGRSNTDDTMYLTLEMYDSEFKSVKELNRIEFMKKRKLNVLNAVRVMGYAHNKDKLFVIGSEGFYINILDLKGNKIGSIKEEYEKVKFTDEDKKKILEAIKANLPDKSLFEQIKEMFAFPKYYPEIMMIQMPEDILTVYTWKRRDEQSEIYFYDSKGKFIKKRFVPIKLKTGRGIEPYPAAIHNWKLYQIIENDEEECWELHIIDIK